MNTENIYNKKAIRISIAYRPLETCLRGGGGSLVPTLSTRCATRGGSP